MITNDRVYRAFEIREAAKENGIVEGYAAVFDDETVLYCYDGIEYKECIKKEAFEKTQMSDVVMNFNHVGKPVARTKNNTLFLFVDNHGLKIRADLTGTDEARKLLEEIKGGYIDKMSFAFTVNEDSYNTETHTRTITGIERLYDVAAVDLPAYDNTEISARTFFEAEAEREKAEARAEALKLRALKIKIRERKNNYGY